MMLVLSKLLKRALGLSKAKQCLVSVQKDTEEEAEMELKEKSVKQR